MKWTLITFLCIVAISNASGQQPVLENEAKSDFPVNIASGKVNKTFTPPPASLFLKSGEEKKCEIIVSYVNFPEEAKAAFEYAVSIYEKTISSDVPIMISATWKDLPGSVLALSAPATFRKNFADAPLLNIYYPIALVEKLSGKSLNDEKDPDIICNFDSQKSWYFGTNGKTPKTKYDFVTVVLHEIAHGLGISGFIADENGEGKINNRTETPSIYDYYIFNKLDQRIADKSIFESPSAQLHSQLTSDKLDFKCVSDCEKYRSKIYAPSHWKNGASIYHFTRKPGSTTDELMSPSLCKGEAIHNPGASTFKVLDEIGWKITSDKLAMLKDIEKPGKEIDVCTNFTGKHISRNETVEIVWSTNYFATKDSVKLNFNSASNMFEGKLLVNSFMGRVQYYYRIKTTGNKTYTQPRHPEKHFLTFRIGADNLLPALQHNPVKLISSVNPVISLSAVATDNTGVGSVVVEYKINNIAQKPVKLNTDKQNVFKGVLNIGQNLTSSDIVEYRIYAEDISSKKNKKYLPEKGFFRVNVFELQNPVESYITNFNATRGDFITTDFEINTPAGFSNANLHTNNPYRKSCVDDKRCDLTAMLNVPVIIKDNGEMTFDEVVLVEPGEQGSQFTDKYFFDYVIVEGSKDGGKTWHPFIDGYDSRVSAEWESKFSSTLKSSTSGASAEEEMFLNNSINLTDNSYFSAGDTVIFRFRLASDESVSGWGWAIDNLKIQTKSIEIEPFTSADEITPATEPEATVYPNPFTDNLFIDCSKLENRTEVIIQITSLTGKTVYSHTIYDTETAGKVQINLSDIKRGVYLASVTDGNLNRFVQKIIKN